MASTKEYRDYILDQLSGVDGVSSCAMMGEYLLRYRGKVIGGIYDDRLLLKSTPSARELLPDAPEEFPYPGAKPMLLTDADNRELLAALLPRMYKELPEAKKKR